MKVKLVAATVLDREAAKETGYIPHEDWSSRDDQPTDPDELGEISGRLCYLSWNRPNPKTATNEGYLANILDHGHYSVLEHASVTLYVEGVSRALLLELERHRFLSFSVVSQRYVDQGHVGNFPFVDHPVLSDLDTGLVTEVQNRVYDGRALYDSIVNDLAAKGHDRKAARGAARLVLEEGTTLRMFVTANLRAWRDIIQKRNSEHADQEIREFAQEVLKIVKEYAPNSFSDFKE